GGQTAGVVAGGRHVVGGEQGTRGAIPPHVLHDQPVEPAGPRAARHLQTPPRPRGGVQLRASSVGSGRVSSRLHAAGPRAAPSPSGWPGPAYGAVSARLLDCGARANQSRPDPASPKAHPQRQRAEGLMAFSPDGENGRVTPAVGESYAGHSTSP